MRNYYNPPRQWTKYRFQSRVQISAHLVSKATIVIDMIEYLIYFTDIMVNKHLKIRMGPRSSLKNVPNEQLTKQGNIEQC